MDTTNVPAKFEVRSFTRSWDNRGYFKTLGSIPIIYTPTLIFLQNFNGFLFGWTLLKLNVSLGLIAKFEVLSCTRSWDNSGT